MGEKKNPIFSKKTKNFLSSNPLVEPHLKTVHFEGDRSIVFFFGDDSETPSKTLFIHHLSQNGRKKKFIFFSKKNKKFSIFKSPCRAAFKKLSILKVTGQFFFFFFFNDSETHSKTLFIDHLSQNGRKKNSKKIENFSISKSPVTTI